MHPDPCINSGGNGNLLLNVGPMINGRIEQRQIDRLKEIGEWLNKYGESIYGTRGGPFKPQHWIASTHKGNKIYVHLLKWPDDTVLVLELNKSLESFTPMDVPEHILKE